jgi:hypothetical protein
LNGCSGLPPLPPFQIYAADKYNFQYIL